jgi:hypothetical protein
MTDVTRRNVKAMMAKPQKSNKPDGKSKFFSISSAKKGKENDREVSSPKHRKEEEEEDEEDGESDADTSSDEDNGDSDSDGEKAAENGKEPRVESEPSLKFNVSDPLYHYKYSLEPQFVVVPSEHINSKEPLEYTIPAEDAPKVFVPDSRRHVDISVKNSTHKNVAIDKAIPKVVGVTKLHNQSPFKVGIRAEGVEAINTSYFNSGALRGWTKNMFLAILEPEESVVFNEPRVIYDGSSLVSSDLARKYGHIDPHKIKVRDVDMNDDTGTGSIDLQSPYIDILNASSLVNRDARGRPTYLKKDGRALLDNKTISKVIILFENRLHSQLVYWDLTKFKLSAYVLGPSDSWSDLNSTKYATLSDSAKAAFMKRPLSIDIGLSVEVAFPSLKPPTEEKQEKIDIIDKNVRKTKNSMGITA